MEDGMDDRSVRPSDFGCQHCTVNYVARDLVLVGGFNTRLCNPCANELEVSMRDHELLIELNDTEDSVAMFLALSTADGIDRIREVREAKSKMRKIEARLFDISKQWVESGI